MYLHDRALKIEFDYIKKSFIQYIFRVFQDSSNYNDNL